MIALNLPHEVAGSASFQFSISNFQFSISTRSLGRRQSSQLNAFKLWMLSEGFQIVVAGRLLSVALREGLLEEADRFISRLPRGVGIRSVLDGQGGHARCRVKCGSGFRSGLQGRVDF